MFCDEDLNVNILNCSKCYLRLDEPLRLPCESIICKCCDLLLKLDQTTNEFKCPICAEMHIKPEQGFPVHTSILKILSIRPSEETNESDSFEVYQKSLNDIITRLNKLQINVKQTELTDLFECKIDETDYARSLLRDRINEMYYEFSMQQQQESEIKFKKTIQELLTLHNEWIEYLKYESHLINQLDKQEEEFHPIEVKFNNNNKQSTLTSINESLLSIEQFSNLLKLCQLDSKNLEWTLVYKATRDGFGAIDFHSKCNSKSNTLVVVKSTNGNIFGGYTQQNWSGDDGFKSDANAFLFSLNNKHEMQFKLKCMQADCAVYVKQGYSACFGRLDLCLRDNSNKNFISSSETGNCYALTPTNTSSSLASTQNFQTVEIEVFTSTFRK
jgi:hypothetical protein